jgi:hypothetical protein
MQRAGLRAPARGLRVRAHPQRGLERAAQRVEAAQRDVRAQPDGLLAARLACAA